LFIHRLQKFLSLEPADQRILIYAFCLVVFARLVLWVIPFTVINRRLASPVRPRTLSPRRDVDYFMSAIERTSRYVPGATCLTQALAARLLLARSGFDATLRFGARRNESGGFEAHAWVESNGKIVSHEQAGPVFSPLPPVG
jgi:Transglutaminase-like superfamily